jgi:hypothetical protein
MSHFALMLDSENAGWVQNVQGGGAVAEIVQEAGGPSPIVKKHIGAIKYEDVVLDFGTGMSKAFYEWVSKASRMAGAAGKSGAVIACDANYKEVSRLEWSEGLITEIAFPAADGASKNSGLFTLKISPERTKHSKKAGAKVTLPQTRKPWLTNSFRLEIDGLEEACRRVTRVEPIMISWKKVANSLGETRDYSYELGPANLGNLMITLPESHSDKFQKWFEDFVIGGNNGPEKEKDGSLEFLTSDAKSGLFTLEFRNLGILRMTRPTNAPGAELRKVKIEMYCESITFSATAAA